MNNHVHHLFKRYFCQSQFFIIRLALVCSILLVVYIYLYPGDVDKIFVQKDSNQQKQDTNQQKVTDMNATHINGFLMEQKDSNQQKQDTNQQKVTDMNATHIDRFLMEQKDSNQQKQDTNQQKVTDMNATHINGFLMKQKDSNQQKQNTNQQKVTNMNATHINGFLMESVHANYTRNIYFTIKTTHRYYAYRLFPIMLTWLQSVDKNKVSFYYNYNIITVVL